MIFDTGPVITLSVNALLWLLHPLKKKFHGKFIITEAVRKELIDAPLRGKKYQFEALRVQDVINEKVFEIIDSAAVKKKAKQLMDLANSCFSVRGTKLKIVHTAEIESLAAAVIMGADALVIDERTTRVMVEDPESLEKLLEQKMHKDVIVNKDNLEKFKQEVKNIKVIRSVELVTVAYKMGLLNKYVTANHKVNTWMKNKLLYAALWALKLYGCAISQQEINEIVRIEK
jgi:predicted nucleic acid-binding protein